MSKMGSHDPFGHLTHKLWPKERSKVKLTIWLPTIKSRESPRFPCVQVAFHIPLENSRQGVQLFFRLHLNRRFAHKIMGSQSRGSPQKDIWVLVIWLGIKYTIRGKMVASPKFEPWWVLWVQICSWLVLAPKCSNYALTNLLFGLCKFMWVSDCSSFFLIPFRSSNTPLYSQSAANQRACPNSLRFRCFHLRYTFESIKELGRGSFSLNDFNQSLFLLCVQ